MESVLLDAAGHRRSPATMPGYHRGRPPRNKGEEYPADPPTVEEIVAVMRAVGDRPDRAAGDGANCFVAESAGLRGARSMQLTPMLRASAKSGAGRLVVAGKTLVH